MSRIDIKKFFTPSVENGTRVNNFNIIRVVAAGMVIYGHMSSIMGVPVFSIFGQAVSTIGVKILFVISGYLIMKSLSNDSHFGRYIIRRSFRIFPGLIGVVLFSAFVIGPLFSGLSMKEYFSDSGTWLYFKNVVLFPIYSLPGVFVNYTYPNAVNGSLWTLPIEFSLYIALPLIVIILQKLKMVKPGIIVVIAICVFANIFKISHPEISLLFYGTDWTNSFPLLPYFFVGCFFALESMKKLLNFQLSAVFLALLIIFQLSNLKYELLLCFALPYSVLSFALAEQPVFSHWFEKCDFSYGIYLYGFVIQQAVYHQLEKFHSSFISLNVSFAICFICTFVCAVISYYVIERPMQVVSRRIILKMTVCSEKNCAMLKDRTIEKYE